MSIQYTADQLQRKFQGAPGAGGFARIAEVLREEGRHEEALALCQEGLKARPGHLTGLLVLGKVYLDMEKLEEAREQFEAALRQDARCLSALHLLARVMVKMQWQDAAAAYYRSILELEPWDTETLARLRDLTPSGAPMAGFAAAPEAGPAAGFAAAPEAGPGPVPPPPAVEQFDLDQAVDFVPAEPSPGDLAGALEEISLEDALSAPPGPAVPAAPLQPTPSELAEPRPMDILPSAPAPEPAEAIDEPAPISGDDIGERLDSLFGVQDDKPVLKPGPAPLEADPGDATLQLPAFPTAPPLGPETPSAAEAAHEAPASVAAGSPSDLAPEDRVSGEDIEDRLDDLFSLNEGTRTQAALPSAPAGEPATTEAPAAPGFLAAAAASDVAERPAFLGDEPALSPFGAGPAAGAGEPPPAIAAPEEDAPAALHPVPEDVILSAGPDAASTALAPDEVVTGQDVADKLDALFGEPAPRTEPVSRGETARQTPSDTGIFPPPESLPAGTASWAAARPEEDFPGAADTQAGLASGLDLPLEDMAAAPSETTLASSEDYSPARWDEDAAAAMPAADLLTTENMLPRGIADLGRSGRDSAAPVTGEDIEDRLDSLFNLDESEAPAPGETSAVGEAPLQTPGAPSADGRVPAETEADRTAGTPAEPDAPERTLIMPAMRENAADWLARQAGETLILGSGEVLAPEPEAPAAPAPAASGADTVGLEMVDGADIEERLEQIFSPEEAAAQAAKAAADAAIARGEATPEGEPLLPEIEAPALETGEIPLPIDEDGILAQEAPAPSAGDGIVESPIAGTMISGEDIKNRLSEIFEEGPRSPEPPRGDAIAAGSLPESQEPAWEVLPEPDGLQADFAGTEPVPEAVPEAGLPLEPEAESAVDPHPLPEAGASEVPGIPGMPPSSASGSAVRASAASLAPLQDEEEGALEEEENSPQSAAGANVATVTLAEIYFQQGLREQALQIYRQLLEREPGNESVRKRIQEIEASKPEAGPGPGADPRRPRPGLKVPKRKK